MYSSQTITSVHVNGHIEMQNVMLWEEPLMKTVDIKLINDAVQVCGEKNLQIQPQLGTTTWHFKNCNSYSMTSGYAWEKNAKHSSQKATVMKLRMLLIQHRQKNTTAKD